MTIALRIGHSIAVEYNVHRRELFEAVLEDVTRHLMLVLEQTPPGIDIAIVVINDGLLLPKPEGRP